MTKENNGGALSLATPGRGKSCFGCFGNMSSNDLLLRIQTGVACLNFILILIIFILLGLGLITIKNKADEYVVAMNLTPERTGVAMEKTLGIVDNVHAVTANMVPVSNATADLMTGPASASEGNVTMSQAATGVLVGLGSANWTALAGNASLALASASLLNFTVVTEFVRQLSEPEFQATVKEQVIHALGSFDFATSGAGNLFKTLRDGVLFSESSLGESKERHG